MNKLGILMLQVIKEPVYIVGNSLGGYVALYFAACNPDLVKGVTLLNATPFWGFLPNPIKSPRLSRIFPMPGTFPIPAPLRKMTELVYALNFIHLLDLLVLFFYMVFCALS